MKCSKQPSREVKIVKKKRNTCGTWRVVFGTEGECQTPKVNHWCIVSFAFSSGNMFWVLLTNIKATYLYSAYQWGSVPHWQLHTAPPPWSSGEQIRMWCGVWCHRPPWPHGHCGSSSELWCGSAPAPLCPTPASASITSIKTVGKCRLIVSKTFRLRSKWSVLLEQLCVDIHAVNKWTHPES